jgi:hypothetical protein
MRCWQLGLLLFCNRQWLFVLGKSVLCFTSFCPVLLPGLNYRKDLLGEC